MSLVTPQNPPKRTSRKPKSPAPKPPDTQQTSLLSRDDLMQAVSNSPTVPAASKPGIIRTIELYYCAATQAALNQLYNDVATGQCEFASAFCAFVKVCPVKTLRERYHARLNAIASTHPNQAAAIQIMRDLDSQMPGITAVLELLAVGQESELTVERLARRFKGSHFSMISTTLAGAIIGLDRSPEPTATTRPWSSRHGSSNPVRLSHGL